MNEPQTPTSTKHVHTRVPWVAKALTHIAPGLGHLYCGEPTRAMAIYFAGSLLLPLILLVVILSASAMSWLLLGMLIIGVAIWMFAARDIKRVLNRATGDYQLQSYNRVWLYVLIAIQPIGYIIPTALLARNHLLEAYVIVSDSMSPSLLKTDRVLVDKRQAGAKLPGRGEVVVFRCPGDRKKTIVNRVVGLPGETIQFDDGGRLTINGNVAEYLEAKGEQGKGEQGNVTEAVGDLKYAIRNVTEKNPTAPPPGTQWTIPPDHVFVLGDNRGGCRDSRHFGTVPVGDIQGPVTFIFKPAQRWSRLGPFTSVQPR